MKKILFVCMVVLSVAMLSSCDREDKTTPEYATKTFVTAFYTGDFNTLYKITRKNNHKLIEQIQRAMNKDKARYEIVKKNKIEILDVKPVVVEDSLAECECHFMYNSVERKSTYNLCKEDGKWLVDVTLQMPSKTSASKVTVTNGQQTVVR